MQTMLISVPELIDGRKLKYEVTAKPKIVNKEMIDRNETQITKVARDEQLPYTGVLNWPIAVLVITGIVIFCMAWLKAYSTSKKSRIDIFFMIFAVLMLVSAGILLFYNSKENNRVEQESLETVTEYLYL